MAESTMEEVVNLEEELLPCDICGRTFLPVPLKRHTRICERNATKKRKVFDSQKQRVEGTEIASFQQPSQVKKPAPVSESPKKTNKWKERHLELVNTIRAARNVNVTVEMSCSSSTTTFNNPTIATGSGDRCPCCDRQFGPRAFDRHVEWCKERTARVKKSPADVLLAKERLAARTKYKVPLPIKSKRTAVKEKYSPTLGNRVESFNSTKSKSCANLERISTTNKSKSVRKNSEVSVYDREDATDSTIFEEAATKKTYKERSLKEKKSLPEIKSTLDLKSPRTSRLLILKNKINTVEVNTLESMTVSHLSNWSDNKEAKRLVTWKDTVNNDISKGDDVTVSPSKSTKIETAEQNELVPITNVEFHSKPCSVLTTILDEHQKDSKKLNTEVYQKKKQSKSRSISNVNEDDSYSLLNTKGIKSLLVQNFTKLPVRKFKKIHAFTSKINMANAKEKVADALIEDVNQSTNATNQDAETDVTSDYNDDSKLSRTSLSNEEEFEKNSKLPVRKFEHRRNVSTKVKMNRSSVHKSLPNEHTTIDNDTKLKRTFLIPNDDDTENNSKLPVRKPKARRSLPSKLPNSISNTSVEEEVYPRNQFVLNFTSDECSPKCEKLASYSNERSQYSPLVVEEHSESNSKLPVKKSKTTRSLLDKMPTTVFFDTSAEEVHTNIIMDKGYISYGCKPELKVVDSSLDAREDEAERNSKLSVTKSRHGYSSQTKVQICTSIEDEKKSENVNTSSVYDKKVNTSLHADEEIEMYSNLPVKKFKHPHSSHSRTYLSNSEQSVSGMSMCDDTFSTSNTENFPHSDLDYAEDSKSLILLTRNDEKFKNPNISSKVIFINSHISASDTSFECESHTNLDLETDVPSKGSSKLSLSASVENETVENMKFFMRKSPTVQLSKPKNRVFAGQDVSASITEHFDRDYKNKINEELLTDKKLADYILERPSSEDCTDSIGTIIPSSFERTDVVYKKMYDGSLHNSCTLFQTAKKICETERYTGDDKTDNKNFQKSGYANEISRNETGYYQFDNVNIEEFSKLDRDSVDRVKSKKCYSATVCDSRSTMHSEKLIVLRKPQEGQLDLDMDCDESDIWNVALNLARLEQSRRNCSSAVHVQSKDIDFVSFTETNLEESGNLYTAGELYDSASLKTNFTGECVPAKRRKLIDKVPTAALPLDADSDTSLNDFDKYSISNAEENKSTQSRVSLGSCTSLTECLENYRSKRLSKPQRKISPRLLAIINMIKSDQKNTDNNHLVTLSTEDCRRLFELDPTAIKDMNSGCKLPAVRTKEFSKTDNLRKNLDDSKICLPPISKIPVTKNSPEKNLSGPNKISTPTLPEITPKSAAQLDYNPFLTAERQLMELLECDDFKPFFTKKSPSKPTQRPHTVNITKTNQNRHVQNKILKSAENVRKKLDYNCDRTKRASVIDPPSDFQDADDFEIIESLINQNFIEGRDEFHILNNTSNKIFSESIQNLLNPLNDRENNLSNENSKYNDDIPTIDPRLINENDNLAIPKNLIVDSSSSNSSNDHVKRLVNAMDGLKIETVNTEKLTAKSDELSYLNSQKPIKPIIRNTRLNFKKQPKQGTSKSTLSLNSSFLSNKIGSDKKKSVNTVKRSVSIREAPNKPNLKSKQDVEQYFNQQEKRNNLKPNQPNHPEGLGENESPKAEDLFSIDDEMYEEYKKYEQLYLKEKHSQNLKTEIPASELTDCEDPEFVGRCNLSKSCTDSAYSSLNRSNPKIRSKLNKLNPLKPTLTPEGSPSSSSSEAGAKTRKKKRMSKFCHECGCKYPIDTAKFCVECGAKRLVL